MRGGQDVADHTVPARDGGDVDIDDVARAQREAFGQQKRVGAAGVEVEELGAAVVAAHDVDPAGVGGELIDGGPWLKIKNPNTGKEIVVKDVIADAFLQQILLRPAEYDVIACMNLNGDYISDALAAQVGGIGIAPGANIGDECALFEATHGTAPKYAGQDKVNPGSIILSAEMMLRHMQWFEAADLIVKGMEGAIAAKTVTYDFERLMDGAKLLKSSEFGDAMISHM